MTTDELKKHFLRIWDGEWHGKESAAVIRQSFADDFTMNISSLAEPIPRAAWIEFVARWQKAFPDGRMDVNDLAVVGDKVWCYWTSTGTHSAEYLGVPATGKKVNYKGVDIYLVKDGKLAKCWAVPDALALLRQLGALPS